MKPDLYQILGVERGASKGALRRAYRKAAKAAHPDTPNGSDAKFKRLQTALMVLGDDKRRQRYDETGEFDENQPADNALANLLEEASLVIDIALGNLIKENREPRHADLIAECLMTISTIRLQLLQEIQSTSAAREKWNQLAGRFTHRKGEINYLEQVVIAKRRQVDMINSFSKSRVERLDKVKSFFQEYEYRRDQQPRLPEGPTTISLAQLLHRGVF